LERASEERRDSILLTFVQQAFSDIADEIVDMFDRYLRRSYAIAKQDLDEFRSSMAREIKDNIILFRRLTSTILDWFIDNPRLRSTIFEKIPEMVLSDALHKSERIIRPTDSSYFDFLENR
jgi:predicted nuclease of restriction endonuclease-like RecB superfamily